MSLRQAAFSAGRWTATSVAARVALQLVQTMVLARLLMPADFGLMALTLSALAIPTLFADFGIKRAIIHFDDMDPDTQASLYWAGILFALLLTLLFAACAPMLAIFYDQPALLPIMLFISPVMLINSFGLQFAARAEKELQFRVVAQNEVAAAGFGCLIAVGLALTGAGVLALVAGALSTAVCGAFLAWWRLAGRQMHPVRLKPAEVRPFLPFGLYSTGETLTGTITREADVFVGGMIAAPAGLGFFSIARDMSLRLAFAINPVITRVGLPLMSKVKTDPAALRAVYWETLRLTSSLNFPLYFLLAVFASETVNVVYGPGWEPAGELLRILAIWGLVRSTGNPVGGLLYGTGKARLAFWWNLANLVVYPPLLWIASRAHGITGLAWAALLTQCLVILPAWYFLIRPACGLTLRQFTQALVAPLLLSLGSAVAARLAVDGLQNEVLRLALGSTILLGLYWLSSLGFNRRWTEMMVEAATPVVARARQLVARQ